MICLFVFMMRLKLFLRYNAFHKIKGILLEKHGKKKETNVPQPNS